MKQYGKQNKKQKWMAEYQKLLVEKRPEMVGRVDWATATYLYNQGYNPEDAANKVSKIG